MQQWNALTEKVIIPFLKEMTDSRLIYAYYVNFHYSLGNHVRLAFLTRANQADALTKKMDISLEPFFLKHSNAPGAAPFIHYETSHNIEKAYSPGSISFEQKTTDIILDALVNDEINEEIIFTLAYQLHLVLIKALMASTQPDLAFFARIYDFLYIKGHLVTISDGFIKSLFEKDEGYYYETACEIFNHDLINNSDAIPPYILAWYAACVEEINNLKRVCGAQDVETIHRYITFQLNQQCGLSQNFKSLLYYFVWQILSRLRLTV
jgi:hypothetical protein